MKNKSVTYLLGAVVLLIWGLVGYRIFSATNEDDSSIEMPRAREKVVNEKSGVSDTFELINDYRDPFLGQLAMSFHPGFEQRTVPKRPKKVVAKAPVVVAPPVDWSFVSYLGTIRGKQSKKKLAILKINDKEMMVGDNDLIGELSIKKIGKDSVLVMYKGETKVLR